MHLPFLLENQSHCIYWQMIVEATGFENSKKGALLASKEDSRGVQVQKSSLKHLTQNAAPCGGRSMNPWH